MTTAPVAGSSRRDWLVPFVATLAAMFALQMSNLGFSPLLPAIQHEFSMSFTQLGLFTGIYGLLAIALSVPAGMAARRFGEKPALVVGLIVVACGSVLLSQAETFGQALASRGLTITGYRFAFVCVLVSVACTSPASLKGRTMGVVGAISSLASVIGAPIGGGLERAFGWRLGILGYAGAALVGALVFAAFYRQVRASESASAGHAGGIDDAVGPGRSAFRTPLVWFLALLVGLGGFGQFTVTFFVPSVARSLYGLDAVGAAFIISTGYLCAMVVNLIVGALMDRFDRWHVLGGLFVLLAIASAAMTVNNVLVFRVAAAAELSLGFSAANQLYALAGVVMKGREAGHAIGVVSLGAGLFGYFGPQALGWLRDTTGTWTAGFYMVAIADLITLALIIAISRYTRSSSGPG